MFHLKGELNVTGPVTVMLLSGDIENEIVKIVFQLRRAEDAALFVGVPRDQARRVVARLATGKWGERERM